MTNAIFRNRAVRMVVGDEGRQTRLFLYDPVAKDTLGNRLPVDLSDSGTTVVFRMRQVGGDGTITATVPCTKLAGIVRDNGDIDTGAPYNVPGSGGLISVDWTSIAVSTAGHYEGEFYITFGNGKPLTINNLLRVSIRSRL